MPAARSSVSTLRRRESGAFWIEQGEGLVAHHTNGPEAKLARAMNRQEAVVEQTEPGWRKALPGTGNHPPGVGQEPSSPELMEIPDVLRCVGGLSALASVGVGEEMDVHVHACGFVHSCRCAHKKKLICWGSRQPINQTPPLVALWR